ncbi:MAG TPA: GNAT family N-acetyltransferase [Roseateles sp.]|nr:GNAT family N-acetyltransferase [Roseateles sp.]
MPPRPPLFEIEPGLAARRLSLEDAPLLQAFLQANPEYYERVGGAGPMPEQAHEELSERPPPPLSYREHIALGFWSEPVGAPAELLGFASVDTDLVLAGCWHVALFIVATRLHGQGVAARLYRALEDWARAGGAQWLRLGVVCGNTMAERFWERQGFVQLRLRKGVAAGVRLNSVRVMLKPLGERDATAYLAQVERDRPDAH